MMAKRVRQIASYIFLVLVTANVAVWAAAARHPTGDSPDILSSLHHLSHIVTHAYYRNSFGGIAMYKNKDPTSDPHFLFNNEPRRFRAIEPDSELLRLEDELRQRNLLYRSEVQWLVEKAAFCNDENSRWARNQIRVIIESERTQDMRIGPEFRPPAPAELLSRGDLHLFNQVDGTERTAWMIPTDSLTRGLLLAGAQGGGKTRPLIWICRQLNSFDPPIPYFILDPKLGLKGWADYLNAIYIDVEDISIDLSPPPGLTYEQFLPALMPQLGEIIGVIYGIERDLGIWAPSAFSLMPPSFECSIFLLQLRGV